MPPKKKKSGKKKKKGKKSGKGKEPQMTMEEAILAYQMDVKSRSKEDLVYELRALKEKNERLKARVQNKRLKEEQLLHIKTLLKQAKEKDKEVEQATEVGHEQVETALLDKFDTVKREAAELKELIEKKQQDIDKVRREVEKRKEYKDIGQHEHAKQIKILNQELQDMEDSHSDIAGHLERSLKIAKEEIEAYTESTISKQKDIASEKAANSLDKGSRQEILDNRWLKKEVEIHRHGCEELSFVVEDLEKSNLEIMSELFDCKIEDLKVTRKFYLACVEDVKSSDNEQAEKEGGSDEEIYAKHGTVGEHEEKPEDDLDNYFLPGEDVLEDSPRLGPMELQLLSVSGTHKPVHRLYEPEGTEMVARGSIGEVVRPENYGRPQEWPVTNQMLHTLVTQ